MRNEKLVGLIGGIALVAMSGASAQYRFDPSAADEQGPSIRYFGSAKDEKGALLPGVSVQIDSADSVYVFVTDEEGRFHANLPLDMDPEKVTSKCFKAGLKQLRVTTRLGPKGMKPSVQLDCVLRR